MYNIIMELKNGGDKMSPRTGRPTDCRKDHDIKVRIDDNTHQSLLKYCEKNNITKAEAIRRGIHLILEQK